MVLDNKLGINNSVELAKTEEKISKSNALKLFEAGLLDTFPVGSFEGLQKIHDFLFNEIYDFSGKIREVNIAKRTFRFAPVMYLEFALKHIDEMPQSTFDEIIEKYVEMNMANPFREGNGFAFRIDALPNHADELASTLLFLDFPGAKKPTFKFGFNVGYSF